MDTLSKKIQNDPISEDPGDIETQIRELEEEKGIHINEEVVVSPTYEESDDEVKELVRTDDLTQRPATGKSVRFTGRAEAEDQALFAENTEAAKKLEYPRTPMPHEEEESVSIGLAEPGYPSSSPPAYTPSDGNRKSPNPVASIRLTPSPHANTSPFRPEDLEEDEYDEELLDEVARHRKKFGFGPEEFTTTEIAILRMVDQYKADEVEITPQYKPFMLEYLPAIGDIDSFLKVPRPDEIEDNMGLTELDEPAAVQSDPTILGMQIRSVGKQTGTGEAPVKKLDRADKNKDEIENWIKNVRDLHRTRPSPSVTYKTPMPDIERLMQEWPEEFQEKLKSMKLPTVDLDCSLEEYVDICLSLFDIPCGKSRIQALHLLSSLYLEFKQSQHFNNMAQTSQQAGTSQEITDRLEL